MLVVLASVRRLHECDRCIAGIIGQIGEGVQAEKINKVSEGRPHVVDAIKNGGIQLVFNTTEGAQALADSRSLRRSALLHKVPYYTTLAGAIAAAQGIRAYRGGDLEVRALQDYFA